MITFIFRIHFANKSINKILSRLYNSKYNVSIASEHKKNNFVLKRPLSWTKTAIPHISYKHFPDKRLLPFHALNIQ